MEQHEDVRELERGHIIRCRHAELHEAEVACVGGGELLAAPSRPLIHHALPMG